MSTTLKSRRLVAIGLMAFLTAVAAIAAATQSTASAAATNGYKSAKFRIEVKGWAKTVQQHSYLAEDECARDNFSSGSETIRFQTKKPIVITAAMFSGLDNPEFFSGRRLGIPTRAVVNRSYTLRNGGAVPEDCPDNGGGVVPTPPDCGRKVKDPWQLELAYLDDRRGLLGLSYSGGMLDPYKMCAGAGFPSSFPHFPESKGSYGRGGPIAAQLSQRDLFNRNFRKWISIAEGVYKQRTATWWARTTVHWEVSFTRLRSR